MPITEAQKKATMKYMKNNYDRIELKVPKGKKATLQAHAAENEESLNGFVNRAIDEAVERDNSTDSPPGTVIKLTDEEKEHIEKRRAMLTQV